MTSLLFTEAFTTGSCDAAGVSSRPGLDAGVVSFEPEPEPESHEVIDMVVE